jgi:hypothetical protein
MALSLDISAAVSPALIKRGCVNVVGLDAVRAQTGARWEKSRESIYTRLEALLGNKLGPTDFYFRLDEISYLVVLPGIEGPEARLYCMKISHDLHRSLLGKCTIADLSLSQVCGQTSDGLELRKIELPELAELAVRAGMDDVLHGPAASAPALPPAVRGTPRLYRYVPVWDARHEAITAYRLDIDPPLLRRSDTPPAREEFREALKALLAGLSQATYHLTMGLRSGNRYLMIVAIPYDVIGAPAGRMEIAAALKDLASELRPFLVFEICGSPPGVPQSRVSELTGSIRPFCRAVTIELPCGALDHLSCQNAGQQGIGITLPALAPPPGVEDEVTRLAAVARKLGLTSFVNGLPSLELADHARRAGVHYLSGPLFGPSVEAPGPMRRLAWGALAARKSARGRHADALLQV